MEKLSLQGLILKISKELLKVISRNERSAVIGSILTSLGVLRFRDEKLIDELSTWIVQHRDHIRPQEISSLLVTLAYLGYTPQNFDEVTEVFLCMHLNAVFFDIFRTLF